MSRLNRLVIMALVAMLAVAIFVPGHSAAQSGNAQVRVVHASPDAGNVDVFADGNKALSNVPYKAISDPLAVPAGTHKFQVAPTGKGADAAVITADGVNIEAGKHYTVLAIGTVAKGDLKLLLEEDDLSPLPAGKARIRITHASDGAPNVDVIGNGVSKLATNLAYGSFSDYVTVDSMSANVEVRPAGSNTAVLTVPNVQVMAGHVYNAVAIGLVGNTSTPLEPLLIDDTALTSSPVAAATPTIAASSSNSSGSGAMPTMPQTGNGFDYTWLIILAALALTTGIGVRRLTLARTNR